MPTTNGIHSLSPALLNRAVNVIVVGAGGSGSHIVTDLAVLNQSMLDLGHPEGLNVAVIDDDTVSEANVGRSRFYAADVGSSKAHTLVNRVNVCYGFNFRAIHTKVMADSEEMRHADIVVGCVDTRESRRSIAGALGRFAHGPRYWLDLGNGATDGQVVLGEVCNRTMIRLPCVIDLFPEMLDPASDPPDAGPSCSRAEALQHQSAFVNKHASLHAVTMLSMLFRYGRLDHSAVFFNLQSGRASVLPCSLDAWMRFGYDGYQSSNAGTQAA